MLPENQHVVSPKRFDVLFKEQALIAEFPTAEDEAAYERRDSFLIHLIKQEVVQQFGSDTDRTPFVGDDWWPDHTRHLEVTPEHCTPVFLKALLALLSGDFCDYRIQLCVYADHMDGHSYIGTMALYAERILIEERLHTLLTRNQKT